tara:strand:- start:592 stop:2082 length:1491 start_codon:yes stop_codon:yes gene_type:complete
MQTSRKTPICFNNSFVELGEKFYAKLNPTPVEKPQIVKLNDELSKKLGIDLEVLELADWASIFSGNKILPGSEPLAMVYAGHQFGHLVPKLGDGRAILLGEVIDNCSIRNDIQLKGSGITPFSRQGDGRAGLGPVLREYIISEAMYALGIPTTRSLCAVTTGEPVYREKVLPGAVLTRVASGHVRTGTFQYFALRGDEKAITKLANYVIDRNYPEVKESPNIYLKLLEKVMDRHAKLVTKWLHVGFIHGVMNTDNMALSGETIDYGPCAFMDSFNKAQVYSSIDHSGRYSYGNQPNIVQWNLARLAETLLPLIDKKQESAVEMAKEVIELYSERFKEYWLSGMRQKLGLFTSETEDENLIESLLNKMHENEVDFTLAFRRLSHAALDKKMDKNLRNFFKDALAYDKWSKSWRSRLSHESVSPEERTKLMFKANPAVIPRNHRVEQALNSAVDNFDFAPFEKLVETLSLPYKELKGRSEFMLPPKPGEHILQTFCGT